MQETLRQACRNDIPGMHRVRLAVRENALTSNAVTEEHYLPAIESNGRGWVIEHEGEILAFAVGNAQNGNIWALFVDPAHEGKGFGRLLHASMTSWLFEQKIARLNLSTASGTRAQRFYESAGWRHTGVSKNGEEYFELFNPSDA